MGNNEFAPEAGFNEEEDQEAYLEGLLSFLEAQLNPVNLIDQAVAENPDDTLEVHLDQVDLMVIHVAVSYAKVEDSINAGKLLRKLDNAVAEQKRPGDPVPPIGSFAGEEGYVSRSVRDEEFAQSLTESFGSSDPEQTLKDLFDPKGL